MHCTRCCAICTKRFRRAAHWVSVSSVISGLFTHDTRFITQNITQPENTARRCASLFVCYVCFCFFVFLRGVGGGGGEKQARVHVGDRGYYDCWKVTLVCEEFSHTYQHKPVVNIKLTKCSHQVECPLCVVVWFMIWWSGIIEQGMIIHGTEYHFWDQLLLKI